jgi:hypothetical protein
VLIFCSLTFKRLHNIFAIIDNEIICYVGTNAVSIKKILKDTCDAEGNRRSPPALTKDEFGCKLGTRVPLDGIMDPLELGKEFLSLLAA